MRTLHLARTSMMVHDSAPERRRRRAARRLLPPIRSAINPGLDLVQEAATVVEIAADADQEPINWLKRIQRWIRQRLLSRKLKPSSIPPERGEG